MQNLIFRADVRCNALSWCSFVYLSWFESRCPRFQVAHNFDLDHNFL